MKQCPECGENLADDAVHCGKCGEKVEESEEEKNNKTMFGMGTVSQEDLEQAAEDAKAASSRAEAEDDGGADDGAEDEDDDDGGGFQLPRPGDTDKGDDQSGGVSEGGDSSPDSGSGTRLGLKRPTGGGGDDEEAALAETEAMPSIDKEKDAPDQPQSGGTDLDGGRIPGPPDEESSGVGSSPSVGSETDPAGGDGSPFADEEEEPQTGVNRQTQGAGRPVPEGPGDPGSMSDTTPDPDPETRGPEAETAPDRQAVPSSATPEAGGDTMADAGPSPADGDSGPPDGPPQLETGGTDQTDQGGAPLSGTAETSGDAVPDVGDSVSETDGMMSDTGDSMPESGGSSTTDPPLQSGESAVPSPAEPVGDDDLRATSPDGQTGPVEESSSALADDDRFGGGPATDAPRQQDEMIEQGDEGGLNKKTLFIILGVLAASGVLCAGAGVLVYMFMT